MAIKQDIKVAVDAVVFGYSDKHLQVLLIKRKNGNEWALPGGFVKDEESLDTAALRELKEETGVEVSYMEQLYTFGKPDRDPRGRIISVAYLALVNPDNFNLQADTDAADAAWFSTDKLPPLAFDHTDIWQKGRERLRNKISYQPLGFDLLDKKFPFSDLENLYKAITGKQPDRRNFRKKLLSFGLLKETGEMYKPQSGRPAQLYTFDADRYRQLEKEGFLFEIKFV